MKTRIFFLSGSLIAVLVASCAPAANPTLAPVPNTNQAPATNLPDGSTPQAQATVEAPSPVAAATSRGPNLEATDPSTVSLASGSLQLVEIFRYT